MKGFGTKVDRLMGDPVGTPLDETGEMSLRDIEPGGEHYEWAQAIEAAAKEIELMTDGKFRFNRMRPFDKYQGPYAVVSLPDGSGASLWDAQTEPGGYELYLDGPEWIGTPEELAPALLGDEEAIKIVAARYQVVQEPTESRRKPPADEIEVAVDRMLEQDDAPVKEQEAGWSAEEETEYFEYLDELRDSGETNMYGARRYLVQAFGLDKGTAGKVLSKWMATFGQRHPEESQHVRTDSPPELSESLEVVGRVISKAAKTIKGLERVYPSLGFGDTGTDEEIADVFRKMLKGKRVRHPSYEFLYLGDEPSAEEKAKIAAATRKVTEILGALVIDIDNEMDVNFTPSIIEWLVEEFYGILHG